MDRIASALICTISTWPPRRGRPPVQPAPTQDKKKPSALLRGAMWPHENRAYVLDRIASVFLLLCNSFILLVSLLQSDKPDLF